MTSYTAVLERCEDTGLLVGHVPDFPGAHSYGENVDDLRHHLREVIAMLREDTGPDSAFVVTCDCG